MYGLATYLQGPAVWRKAFCILWYLRASQMNGCAFCIDMHTDEAAGGWRKSCCVSICSGVWRETPLFSEREQVALAWTEAVTQIIEADLLMNSMRRPGNNSPKKSW